MTADGRAAAQYAVPLPRPRPTDLHAPPPAAPDDPKAEPKEAARDEACLDRLKAAGIQSEPVHAPAGANPACVIDTPVRLTAYSRFSES